MKKNPGTAAAMVQMVKWLIRPWR